MNITEVSGRRQHQQCQQSHSACPTETTVEQVCILHYSFITLTWKYIFTAIINVVILNITTEQNTDQRW